MKEYFLETLSCPYCGYKLEVNEILTQNQSEIENAILKCECSYYPLIDGILVLEKSRCVERAVDFLKKKLFLNALHTLLEVRPFTYTHRLFSRFDNSSIPFLNKCSLLLKKGIFNKKLNQKTSFFELVKSLRWKNYGEYLKYRFSDIDFIETSFIIHLLMSNKNDEQKYILDICCGIGHGSFLLSFYVNPEHIVCSDLLFVNLYVAKHFFNKEANFVCLDANEYLPFKNNYFSGILCSNAFFAIRSKRLFANELERVLGSHGFLILTGLPNCLKTGRKINGRETLSPQGYVNLFNNLEVRLLPHGKIIESILRKDELDLKNKFPESEVDDSDHFILLGSKSLNDFKFYQNFSKAFFKKLFRPSNQNLIINPIYETKEKRDAICLIKKSKVSNRRFARHLTKSYVLKKKLLNFLSRNYVPEKELDEIYDLWKQGILIFAPKNYVTSKT